MRAAVFLGPRRIEVADRPDPVVAAPTDAVVRVVLGCVCGSDLWYYRGASPHALGPIGHEFIGVVEQTGSEVGGIAKGDLVIAPFTYSDGTCAHCRAGWTSNCVAGGSFGNHGIDGGQGEVGLCAVIAARRLGAARVIALSRNPSRQEMARSFGATDVVAERGEAATQAVLGLTGGIGVDAALECVGTGESMKTAFAIARPGSIVGAIGAPHGGEVPLVTVIFPNVDLHGGV